MPTQVEKKMQDKPITSVVIVPTARLSRDEGDTTEITVHISIPNEGGWGWVVLVTSFLNIFIVDGVIFSFGALYPDIRNDLQEEEYLISIINSVAYAMYFMGGPIASGIINRYGFRECTMIGSMVMCASLLCTYFSPNYGLVLLFYGLLSGFGASLVNMPSNIVVGFYFEKIRAIVLSIASSGSSGGVMLLYPLSDYLSKVTGWRLIVLFHSGLCGICYFLGMTYIPLTDLSITKTTDGDIPTVTYLPETGKKIKKDPKKEDESTVTERLFNTVSNARFPTAATVVEEGVVTPAPGAQAGTSTVSTARLTITAHAPSGASHKQLKSIHDMLSQAHLPDKANKNMPMEIIVEIEPPKKRSWWKSCCQWKKNIPGARPMYRDDAFYAGKVENLPVYKKSVANISPESRTGLEYQMAVTRAATAADIREKRGIFTTAFKRILVTMVDPKLLKRCSFVLLCISAFCTCVGLLVPYVFLAERNKQQGMDPDHCTRLISVIGFTNLLGRLILGSIAIKIDPVKVYLSACLFSGLASIASTFTYDLYYQYVIAGVYGFFIGSLVNLRSLVLVNLYGLDMLTNATGLMVLFQGLGGLIGTPLASVIKGFAGFEASFICAGFFVFFSGLVLFPVKLLVKREDKAAKLSEIAPTIHKNDDGVNTDQKIPPTPRVPPLSSLSDNPQSRSPSKESKTSHAITKLQSNVGRPPQ